MILYRGDPLSCLRYNVLALWLGSLAFAADNRLTARGIAHRVGAFDTGGQSVLFAVSCVSAFLFTTGIMVKFMSRRG